MDSLSTDYWNLQDALDRLIWTSIDPSVSKFCKSSAELLYDPILLGNEVDVACDLLEDQGFSRLSDWLRRAKRSRL